MSGENKRITLALQGGGSHGAFTWGVLDRLLEERALEIEAISGTSAGAMNAAVLAHGLVAGGAAAAKTALHDFWESVSQAGESVFDASRYFSQWPAVKNLASVWSEALTSVWSPYDNPAYANPLRKLLAAIDFERLRKHEKPRIFVCATNVRTNARKIFTGAELSVEAVLASCCIPTVFQAVELGGEHYWDGGYTGNPALEPLLGICQDILVVEVNALSRDEIPRRADDIVNRLNEITFNSALVQEIRTIETMNKLLAAGKLVNTGYKPIRFHAIEAEQEMSSLGVRSKNNTDWTFLLHLHELGRASAQAWLQAGNFDKIGRDRTVDVEKKYVVRSLPR
jgi:NTE family protein